MVNNESKTFKPLDKNIKKTRVVQQHQKREIKQASKKKKNPTNTQTQKNKIRPKKDFMQFISNKLKTKIIQRGRLKIEEDTSVTVNICYIFWLSSIFENVPMLREFLLMCSASSRQKPGNSFCQPLLDLRHKCVTQANPIKLVGVRLWFKNEQCKKGGSKKNLFYQPYQLVQYLSIWLSGVICLAQKCHR